ncbi:MAG: FAD-dependent oxidoreductase, partial [Deltaproteobacteria bacterium]|nr:FAD-dependent oxidoreductase [Deltaproteobacteria bacterium]
MKYDVIIIGAGASGLMCAAEAAKRDKSVIVIEHNEEPGNKIFVSGGG